MTVISGSFSSSPVDHIIDMIAHKKPNLAVMEIDMVATAQSAWLEPNTDDKLCRAACRRYLFTSNSSISLLEVQRKHQQHTFAEFTVYDILEPSQDVLSQGKQFDLVIVKLVSSICDVTQANLHLLTLFRSLHHLHKMSRAP